MLGLWLMRRLSKVQDLESEAEAKTEAATSTTRADDVGIPETPQELRCEQLQEKVEAVSAATTPSTEEGKQSDDAGERKESVISAGQNTLYASARSSLAWSYRSSKYSWTSVDLAELESIRDKLDGLKRRRSSIWRGVLKSKTRLILFVLIALIVGAILAGVAVLIFSPAKK